ncbi:hypothetical protein [Gorillibacterium sp. sgz5001074]|uniref:hypothetical protein n=1 Tax=Gorillibacterium sp. sgz5001074 TaxID=3446695 RepID=UPI003F670E60
MQPTHQVLPNDTFEERAVYLLHHMADSSLPPEWDWRRRLLHHSIARLGLGVRTAEAVSHIARVVRDPGDHDRMFLRHPLSDIVIRFAEYLPAELREEIRDFLCRGEEYHIQSGTENHKLMNAVSGCLAAETWPDWADAQEVSERCRNYLDGYYHHVTHYGQGEFDSTTYAVLYLNTLASLHDLTQDPVLKRKTAMMLDWYLINTAGEWMHGHMAGAVSREYGATDGPELPGGSLVSGWLYFGGRMPNLYVGEPHYSVINALSGYRLHRSIAATARIRKSPYLHLESHDLTAADGPTHDNHITAVAGGGNGGLKGYGYISRAGVRKTTYMAPGYALGSMTDGKEGDIVWSGQLRRWSLRWDSPGAGSVMFVTHPFPDFHPEKDPYRAQWQGSSPYEQVLQVGRTLVAVFRIPAGTTYKFGPRQPFPSDKDPYIEGFLSRTSIRRKMETGGWLFAHGGTVLFALRFAKPYEWICETTRSAALPIHGRVRSMGLHHAVIVETADASAPDTDPEGQQAELNAYAERILAGTEAVFHGMEDGGKEPTGVVYRAADGDLLELEYDGDRRVNGSPVNEAQWPLICNPWVFSGVETGRLTIQADGWRREYDYREWTVRDEET